MTGTLYSRSFFAVTVCLCLNSPTFAAPPLVRIENLSELDYNILELLETNGLSLGALLGAPGSGTSQLNSSPMYRDFLAINANDLIEERAFIDAFKEDSTRKIELFEFGWLNSKISRFDLIGVVGRPDRNRILTNSCGEIRLVYRLSYFHSGIESIKQMLPMTVMAVFALDKPAPPAECSHLFRIFSDEIESPELRLQALLAADSILNQIAAQKIRVSRFETNFLLSNWAFSEVSRQSEQSRYLMRVFKPSENYEHLVPVGLESSPDVELISGNPAILANFQTWAAGAATHADAELGVLVLPENFAAKKAISVSPYSIVHQSNSPFSALLKDTKLFEPAFLNRMDSLSCQGCHQIRSIAGFHLLGLNPKVDGPAIVTAGSSHFAAMQSWRRQSFNEVAALPDLHRLMNGGLGDRCDAGPGETKNCNPGFTCNTSYAGLPNQGFGQCLPSAPKTAGSPCDPAGIISNGAATGPFYVDRGLESCGPGNFCAFAKAGFPGGYCSHYCEKESEVPGCLPIPELGPFSECVVKTGKHSLCAKEHSIMAATDSCTQHADCRTDYACTRIGTSARTCAPTYLIPGLTLKHRGIM